MPTKIINDTNDLVLTTVQEQLQDLQPSRQNQLTLADVLANVTILSESLKGLNAPANDATLLNMLNGANGLIALLKDIRDGKKPYGLLGNTLTDLSVFQFSLEKKIREWVSTDAVVAADANALDKINQSTLSVIVRIRQLLQFRPNVSAIMDDLQAIKHLKGGPADAVAFHDFNILQMAFRSVWVHAFDEDLRFAAEKLYEETVKVYEDAGQTVPAFDAIDDIQQLRKFVSEVQSTLGDVVSSPKKLDIPSIPLPTAGVSIAAPPPAAKSSGLVSPPIPPDVLIAYPEVAIFWDTLSQDQRMAIIHQSSVINNPASTESVKDAAKKAISGMLQAPLGSAGRLVRMIYELSKALNEPYAFDVFAPDSFNFGLMITYRQHWEPGEYQAGNLVSTIPLAPGETRKFSKKRVVKESMSKKMMEKSMISRSTQSSETNRAETEIMQKVVTATNFKMTTQGSFNVGIGSITNTTEMGATNTNDLTRTKKDFHEATIKAAEEYKLERSLEIDTSRSVETEEISSGEISNPNNEITVTYLFYELQRRYKISESIYRVRPVILVAQDVPSPHEINEAWLLQYQWILARVLLDESLRPALEYLNSGFAGDEVATEVIKAQWEKQRHLVDKLEILVSNQLDMRDRIRSSLIENTLQQDMMPEMPAALKFFTMGQDPSEGARDVLEANRKAGETRLKYVEEALADAQQKLRSAATAFEQATTTYSTAMQNKHARHTAIDQLRVHVKQNILYYMQAIWSHEPLDQRFFRLYNKKVFCPDEQGGGCQVKVNFSRQGLVNYAPAEGLAEFKEMCVPGVGNNNAIVGHEHELIEVADIDNPLGYKGNYIIFPLKDNCDLTRFMISEFVDGGLGLRDPDGVDDFDLESFERDWQNATKNKDSNRLIDLKQTLTDYLQAARRSTDEIIVPTGQLFIEALPGSHSLLEDFKLMHRVHDVRKVQAEVRHAELENLRLATRLANGQDEKSLLDDPDIEKKITIDGL